MTLKNFLQPIICLSQAFMSKNLTLLVYPRWPGIWRQTDNDYIYTTLMYRLEFQFILTIRDISFRCSWHTLWNELGIIKLLHSTDSKRGLRTTSFRSYSVRVKHLCPTCGNSSLVTGSSMCPNSASLCRRWSQRHFLWILLLIFPNDHTP